MNDSILRVAIVGAGSWSPYHLTSWNRIGGVRIVGLCDKNPEALALRASEFGIPPEARYEDFEEMLRSSGCDAVDIVTRPATHPELVRTAARAGKHILCQKPFSQTVEEAEEMVRAADEAGVRLMVTENWRWLAPIRTIKRIIESGEVGRILSVRYRHRAFSSPLWSPDLAMTQPYFREMPRLLFQEMGNHWFDAWRFLFGTPVRVFAETSTISRFAAGEDSGFCILSHEDMTGLLDMSWGSREELPYPLTEQNRFDSVETLTIEGELATIKLSPTGAVRRGRVGIVGNDGFERIVEADVTYDMYESNFMALSHFAHCIRTGERFETSGEYNLITTKMIDAVYRSAETHRPVLL